MVLEVVEILLKSNVKSPEGGPDRQSVSNEKEPDRKITSSRYCPSCGSVVAESANFCTSCGAKLL
jgi:uncharacterized OB-fold protein